MFTWLLSVLIYRQGLTGWLTLFPLLCALTTWGNLVIWQLFSLTPNINQHLAHSCRTAALGQRQWRGSVSVQPTWCWHTETWISAVCQPQESHTANNPSCPHRPLAHHLDQTRWVLCPSISSLTSALGGSSIHEVPWWPGVDTGAWACPQLINYKSHEFCKASQLISSFLFSCCFF